MVCTIELVFLASSTSTQAYSILMFSYVITIALVLLCRFLYNVDENVGNLEVRWAKLLNHTYTPSFKARYSCNT